VLKPEQLRDAASELVLDGRQDSVGIDDSPDHLDEPKTLLAAEVLGDELRELVEVHALTPFLFGETHELVDVFARDAEILASGAADPVALLGGEVVVGVRDLEEEGARRDRDRIGTVRFLPARDARVEELAQRRERHGAGV